MQHSPLIQLPPELRNDTYRHALHSPPSISISLAGESPTTYLAGQRPLALTETYRHIRQEGRQLVFGTNTFTVYADASAYVEQAVTSTGPYSKASRAGQHCLSNFRK